MVSYFLNLHAPQTLATLPAGNHRISIEVIFKFYFFIFLFYLYIYPPDLQESDGGANT